MTLVLVFHIATFAVSTNGIVRSIPVNDALTIMRKWSLEYKLQMNDNDNEDIFNRMTDDSISGPFKLNMLNQEENKDIVNIRNIMKWIQVESSDAKKGIFVALIEDDESMLAFVQKYPNGIEVNGFLPCPFIDADTHNAARSALALTLLDMASNADTDIVFRFNDS